MNKAELITIVAEKTGESKAATERVLNAITETIVSDVKNGGRVQLIGFGTFETIERKSRNCINPATGKNMTVPACKSPKFKAGKAFKSAVNEKPKAKAKVRPKAKLAK